jgi:hypothetical protein
MTCNLWKEKARHGHCKAKINFLKHKKQDMDTAKQR